MRYLILLILTVWATQFSVIKAAEPEELIALNEAILYKEMSERGEQITIPTDRHLASIDYKSKLVINPDKSLMKSLSRSDFQILDRLSPETQRRLSAIPKLIQEARDYVSDAAKILMAIKNAQVSDEDLTQEQIISLQQQISDQGKKGKMISSLVKEIAEARATERYGDNRKKVVEMTGEITSPIFRKDGKRVVLNIEGFTKFLLDEIKFSNDIYNDDVNTAEKQGTVQFRMRAWLTKLEQQPVAISIENYDDIESFSGTKRPRIAFSMTKEEQQRLDRGYAIAKDAAILYDDLRDKNSTLREGLISLQNKSQMELKSLKSNVQQLTTEIFINDGDKKCFLNAIEVAESSQNATPQQKVAVEELKGFLSSINNDLMTIKEAMSQLTDAADSPTPDALIQLYLAVPEKLQNAIPLILELPSKINKNIKNIQTLVAVLKKIGNAEATRLESIGENAKREAEKLINQHIEKYKGVVIAVKDVINRQQILHMADTFTEGGIDPRVKSLDLDAIVPGTINLNKTPSDRGDQISIKAELFTINESGQEKILQVASKDFHVDRFGFTNEFSASLIFVDRKGKGNVGDPKTNFDPAPSVSWTLRYRSRPSLEAGRLSKINSFLKPGFGINTATIDFEDESYQIGVGTHLSLFDNLLTAGYGYNLHADKDNRYFYLGIGY